MLFEEARDLTRKPGQIPVLFQLDPATREATGTVMPFCSDACRAACGDEHGLGLTVKGNSAVSDFGYEVHCEQCGKPVALDQKPIATASFDDLFVDAVSGLKEYYPLLQDEEIVGGLKLIAYEQFIATGDSQFDYEAVRDSLEKQLNGARDVVIDDIRDSVRRIQSGGHGSSKCQPVEAADGYQRLKDIGQQIMRDMVSAGFRHESPLETGDEIMQRMIDMNIAPRYRSFIGGYIFAQYGMGGGLVCSGKPFRTERKLTSRALAEQYPAKGSMPQAVVAQLYQLREDEVAYLAKKGKVTVSDLATLDRGARFVVATMLFGKCDTEAKQALLHDEHHQVRSAAVLAKAELEPEPCNESAAGK